MKFQIGQTVLNVLPGLNKAVVCRVVEFVESVGMYRLTHIDETMPDAWLIDHNLTWACPIENIEPCDPEMVEALGVRRNGTAV